jgi:hypothetical protein
VSRSAKRSSGFTRTLQAVVLVSLLAEVSVIVGDPAAHAETSSEGSALQATAERSGVALEAVARPPDGQTPAVRTASVPASDVQTVSTGLGSHAAIRPQCTPPVPVEWKPVDTGGPEGESVGSCLRRMGSVTDSRIPVDQRYDLTTFGGPGDLQPVDCRDPRGADGTWYYAANLQRFQCGQTVRLVDSNRERCVIVEVADTGPNACVEEAGGRPAWDVSPLVARHLFGVRSAGWSEKRAVYGAPVDRSNPLGPCDAQLADRSRIAQGSVGGSCEESSQCQFQGGVCLADSAGWPGGYCSAPCDGRCPSMPGAHAMSICSVLGDGSTGCLASCDYTLYESGCRSGYTCGSAPGVLDPEGASNPVCVPERCEG